MFPLTADPRTVSEADFPVTGTPSEQLRFLLNYAVLAPSEYLEPRLTCALNWVTRYLPASTARVRSSSARSRAGFEFVLSG